MKNKFAGAAIIACIGYAISNVLWNLLWDLFRSIIPETLFWIIFDIVACLVTIIGMFIGTVLYGSIAKTTISKKKAALIAIISGIADRIIGYIPLPIPMLNTILTLGVLFLLALCITKDNKPEPQKSQANEAPESNILIANEAMSATAQYAFNEKLAQARASAINIDELVEAKLFAQAVELQLLKSPASAKFCSLEEMTVTALSNGAYIVSGYVDSQNSYGAFIRSPFTITVFNYNGVWKNADQFVDTSAVVQNVVQKQVVSNTIAYWILGIILTIVGTAIFYLFDFVIFF